MLIAPLEAIHCLKTLVFCRSRYPHVLTRCHNRIAQSKCILPLYSWPHPGIDIANTKVGVLPQQQKGAT